MSTAVIKSLSLASLVCLAPIALADKIDVDMQPGLWQSTIKFEGDGATQLQDMQMEHAKVAMAEMNKQLAAMPAEQRKQMEALMAQSGVSLSEEGISINDDAVNISSKGTVAKNCITKAHIERGDFGDSDANCTSTIKKISAKRFKSTQICQGEDASRSEMDMVFDSPKRYTGKGTVTQTVNGKPHVLQIALEGTWLSSDCGKIKPD